MEKVIKRLIQLNKTISTMESCTGGGIANAITNVEGSSKVFSFSAVTYSNEFKIKMGVDSKIIEKYTVYSKETAASMAKSISDFTNSDYGIGVTGKLNKIDNIVYFSIYDKKNDLSYTNSLSIDLISRSNAKEIIIKIIEEKMLEILN